MEKILEDLNDKVNRLKDLAHLKVLLGCGDDDDGGGGEGDRCSVSSYKELALEALSMTTLMKGLQKEQMRVQTIHQDLQSLLDELKPFNVGIASLSMELLAEDSTQSSESMRSGCLDADNRKCRNKATNMKKKTTAKQIPHICNEEFSSVPKYIKNKITCSEVNRSIDILNNVAVSKYNILTKRKPQNDFERTKKMEYANQETNDTRGQCFVSEDDIKEFASMKLDRKFLSTLAIIRHCGKIRQMRSKKLTIYVLK